MVDAFFFMVKYSFFQMKLFTNSPYFLALFLCHNSEPQYKCKQSELSRKAHGG